MATKIFSLEGQGLKLDSRADVDRHIEPLRRMDDVQEVRLLGNTLGVEACQSLGEVLATKKTLQVANLADIFTGRLLSEIPQALTFLLSALLTLPNLHTVNLNDNAFGLNTQGPLVDFLSSHVPLQHLILNNNGLGPEAGIKIANALSLLHAKKEEARQRGLHVPNLETVICGRNRLETGSMEAWASAYSLHTGIKKVKMVQNGIRPDGISHLLRNGLRHAKHIQVLDLQDNTFTTKGARALAIVAPGWTEIEELGVGDSILGPKGSVMVAKALGNGANPKLEILRLQYNDMGTKGLEAFATATKHALPALQRLEINGNKFSQDSEIVEGLRVLLQARKDQASDHAAASGNEWGLDSLSDLEEESDEEDSGSDDEGEENDDELRERVLQEARMALEGPTVQLNDQGMHKISQKIALVNI
ncbi:hypothetical protein K3495_g5898 [Podosphaera aphanis]|nr:hypothetical protein K3495_g5898 [Podosphaera aphanis]